MIVLIPSGPLPPCRPSAHLVVTPVAVATRDGVIMVVA
jgi:hypothetical protein